MVFTRRLLVASAAALLAAGCQGGEDGNMVAGNVGDSSTGGAQGNAGGTIAETAAQSPNLSEFSRAAEAAGLSEVLRSGSYTVFAPVDSAFEAVPEETRTALAAPEGRDRLRELLSYHIVPGVVTSEDLDRAIERGQGRAVLATVAGGNLIFSREGDALHVTDGAGGRALVAQPGRISSNGVIHPLDAVLMPAAPSGD